MLMFNIIVSMIATSSLLLLVSNMSNVKINYTGRLQVNAAYESLQFDLFNHIKNVEVMDKIKDDTNDTIVAGKVADTTCNQKLKCITNAAIDCKTEFDVTKEQPLECLYKKGEAPNVTVKFFDSRTATKGFMLDGTECNDYSTTTPSTTCVFRPEITFKMKDCPPDPAPCVGLNRDIDVFVRINYSSKSPYTINSTSRRLRAVIDN
jgi:hypothetical protein